MKYPTEPIEHTDECIGEHTNCWLCDPTGNTHLNVCISEFGAVDFCPPHAAEYDDVNEKAQAVKAKHPEYNVTEITLAIVGSPNSKEYAKTIGKVNELRHTAGVL